MKRLLIFIAPFTLSACAFGVDETDYKSQVPEVSSAAISNGVVIEPEAKDNTTPLADVELPSQINLEAQFYSQAPEGDWSQPWQDACEEASLLVAHYGMIGEDIDKETFKAKILEMVDWQIAEFGYYESTRVEQVVKLYENYFDDALNVRVIESPEIEDLKQALAQGHLIVGPFAGRMLGNPFYSGEGPYYHMMVVKGYDETHFITHDVGTRHGANFAYSYQTLMNALHDYSETSIETQPGRVIVLESN